MKNLVPNIVKTPTDRRQAAVGCIQSTAKEFKEPFKNNPVSGRVEGLFPEPPDYKYGFLTT